MEQGQTPPPAGPEPSGEQAGLLELGAHLARSFSDALMVINGHATLLMKQSGLSPEVLRHAAAIHKSGGQAARLAQQLLIVSDRHTLHLQPVDLSALVKEMEPEIRRLLGSQRLLVTELPADPAVARTDPDLFEQALLGLAANACAAMEAGGTLSFIIDLPELTAGDPAHLPLGRSGSFVRLTVHDTGCGMTPEVLTRVSAPSSLTGRIGASAGFGLAAIRGIMTASQGWLTLESRPLAGTTVRLYFPAAPVSDHRENPAGSAAAKAGNKSTILLVEDEPALRELMAMTLQDGGYRVLQAGDSAEALEAWKWHAPRIDLLFTDIVLPGDLSGLELAARFQAEKPGLKIVCLSGNSENLTRDNPLPLTGVYFLQKPCSCEAVSQTVKTQLARDLS